MQNNIWHTEFATHTRTYRLAYDANKPLYQDVSDTVVVDTGTGCTGVTSRGDEQCETYAQPVM